MFPRRHLSLLAALAAACSAETPETVVCPAGGCDNLDAGRRMDARVDVRTDDLARDVPGPRTLLRLAVRPEAATLEHRDGVAARARFEAVGTWSDGTSGVIPNAVWSLAPNPAATVDNATGAVTTTGRGGGVFNLVAQVITGADATVESRAILTVNVSRTTVSDGAPMDARARFATAPTDDPARVATVLYPLDGAVIPNNLPPPVVQWERGAAGDLYRVRLTKPHVELQRIVAHSGMAFSYADTPAADDWRALMESDPDDPITLRVDRFDAARTQLIPGAALRLRVARATLSGTIYYWDLAGGRILRIDALTGERSVAVPSPPPKPNEPDRGSRCIACHTVSRDGRFMSVEMWGGGREGAAFDLTASDLGADPAPTVYGPRADLTYLFSTFSPDNQFVMINYGNTLGLIRREGGVRVENTGLPTERSAHPSWSPDGREVAYITNHDGSWAVDFTAGDLAVLPRTGETTFGPPRILHRGPSSPGGNADAHPSWSPDGRFLAFQHGVNSRGAREGAPYPGQLMLTPRDATPERAPVVLANANGAGDPSSFWPNFSPFQQGGYYWLAFYSRRDYGNPQAGTRGTGRRQIWVTAVRTDGAGTTDPSSVPYWLPGQDRAQENMSAYWAPVACRMNLDTCRVSAECCSGLCQLQTNGSYACAPPPPAMCRRAGTTCSQGSDCCEDLQCVSNVCQAPPG